MFRKISSINCEIWGGALIRAGALITVNTVLVNKVSAQHDANLRVVHVNVHSVIEVCHGLQVALHTVWQL